MKVYITALLLGISGIIPFHAQETLPKSFLKTGYIVFEEIHGDLNNDGINDCVLIVKGTDSSKVVINRFDEEVDRNRRGIVILIKKNQQFELFLENYDCFYSENEDGGVYFPPELSTSIINQKLYFDFTHGRYGFWKYTFRIKNKDFELIGYDASNNFGPVINKETSINYLTKKRLTKENINQNSEGGDEIFEETWSKVEIEELIKLSEIEDFYELNIAE
ncbi:hypothetical protein [Brumimicrobium mesophilum]|uniref:hypothetical protein n=1 Tax=Brumimicrobium mesophilum TaxID=392717 RepID=UPI000D13F986|nr:hypothetical protein [Brumimicrobium mesophilum]